MPSLQELETGWVTVAQAAAIVGRSRQGVHNVHMERRLRGVMVGRHEPVGRPVLILDKQSCAEFARQEQDRRTSP